MKLILLATRTGKEFYIKTDLPTNLAILRFELETMETVRHFNDDYCGDANEATHYNYLYLSTDAGDDTPEDDYDPYEHYAYNPYDWGECYAPDPELSSYDEEPVPCPCCGGSGYM